MFLERADIENLPGLIHVLIGPRQVGKSTCARAIVREWPGRVHAAAADELRPPGPEWLSEQWERARALVGDAGKAPVLLVVDEVQKVHRWSEVVKARWDEDRAAGRALRVLLLGSSSLLMQHGLSESLAGRFFLHRAGHWTYAQMRATFDWSLDQWLYFGGYPGTAALASEELVWRSYVRDALVEAAIARDVVAMQVVNRPALMRHLFALACEYAGQALSYNKMLGQLQDAGNTTTIAHYLQLLSSAFLVSGVERFSPGGVRERGSSPKLVVWNNALVNAVAGPGFEVARTDGERWGRIVENAVGAHLLNGLQGSFYELRWWRDRGDEVDYVVASPREVVAIEVKSGRKRSTRGLDAFLRAHPGSRGVVVGSGGVPLEEWFSHPPLPQLGLR